MEQSFRALVKGTYGSLPRGYPWVLLGQYAVVVAVFAVFIARSWAGIAGAVVIFSGGVLMVPVLQRGKTRTFGIDSHGISLGASRHYVRILWRDIQEIRISPAADGVLVDIVLAASAAVAPPRLSPRSCPPPSLGRSGSFGRRWLRRWPAHPATGPRCGARQRSRSGRRSPRWHRSPCRSFARNASSPEGVPGKSTVGYRHFPKSL